MFSGIDIGHQRKGRRAGRAVGSTTSRRHQSSVASSGGRPRSTSISRRAFPRCRLPTLAAGGLLLGGRAALARVPLPAARPGLLTSTAGSSRRVRDLRRSLLGHALFLQAFVLLLVLHAGPLVRHWDHLLWSAADASWPSFPRCVASIRPQRMTRLDPLLSRGRSHLGSEDADGIGPPVETISPTGGDYRARRTGTCQTWRLPSSSRMVRSTPPTLPIWSTVPVRSS